MRRVSIPSNDLAALRNRLDARSDTLTWAAHRLLADKAEGVPIAVRRAVADDLLETAAALTALADGLQAVLQHSQSHSHLAQAVQKL